MGFGDYLKKILIPDVEQVARKVERETRRAIYLSVQKASRYIFLKFFSLAIILFAIIFISLAAIFFLIDYLQIGRVVSLLIIGIILLIVGLIVKINN